MIILKLFESIEIDKVGLDCCGRERPIALSRIFVVVNLNQIRLVAFLTRKMENL